MKKTTIEFIKEAMEIHGDKYDYSKSEYSKAKVKVCIICKIHGEFNQTPDSHLRGQGCHKCGIIDRSKKQKMSVSSFIEKANKKHNNKYNYSLVSKFDNNRSKIKIICPIHGEFEQMITNHLKGEGCRKCGWDTTSKKLSKGVNDFIKESYDIHGNKFDYSYVDYKNSWDKVKIICKIHGEFHQSPVNHISSIHGCPKCADENSSEKRKTCFDDFVLIANDSYDFKYTYHKDTYVNIQTKTKITCPIHGYFWQLPHLHISSIFGCPKCSINCRSGENHYLYNSELTDLERENNRSFSQLPIWRKYVYERDNYRCIITREKTHLNAHHLDGWHWCKEKRFDIDNGVSLSQDIHIEFHKIYGNKNNTLEQFKEFYFEKTGREFVQKERLI